MVLSWHLPSANNIRIFPIYVAAAVAIFCILSPIEVASQLEKKPIVSFSVSFATMCAVFDNKKMKYSGEGYPIGSSTRYGYNSTTIGDYLPYFDVGSSESVDAAICGRTHTCIVLNTRNMKCMGANYYGQAGIPISTSVNDKNGYIGDGLPIVNLGTGLTVVDVILGYQHTCVLVTGNKVNCFGNNEYGQLGYGDIANRGISISDMGDNLTFVDFGTNVEVASLHSESDSHSNCVILSAPTPAIQRFKCWGRNDWFNLGYGDANHRGDSKNEMGDNLTLIDLGTESRVKQLGMGMYHICGLLLNDALKCWGLGSFGMLGSGSTATISSTGNSLPSVQYDSGRTIKILSTGWAHNCIVYEDMISMKCFGWNAYGQLGQGDSDNRGHNSTTLIPSITKVDLATGSLNISSVHSGGMITCVVFVDDSIKCFGDNRFGQFGIGFLGNIGDNFFEMGLDLEFSKLFGTSFPTKAPTTSSPSISPISQVASYDPPKSDCYMIATESECNSETNSKCGKCTFISTKLSYSFRVKVNFTMEGSRKFSEFESTTPKITTFRDALKSLIEAKVDGTEKISITKGGDISLRSTSPNAGTIDYDISFIDNQASKDKAKAYFASNPDGAEYVNDMNTELNKKMNTSGRKYLTGKISISNSAVSDSTKTGACGCQTDTSGSIHSISSITTKMLMLCCMAYIILMMII